MNLNNSQKSSRKKLLDLIYKEGLSHIGSSLSVIDIIDVVYKIKKKNEKFILSNGHAAAALYIILEKYGYIKDFSIKSLGVHPDRQTCDAVDFSTGSLGQGITAALGIALANRKKRVFCMISDGECSEGSVWESLRYMTDQNVTNLCLIVNINGWGAYDPINTNNLVKRLKSFTSEVRMINGHNHRIIEQALIRQPDKPTIVVAKTVSDQFSFLNGLDAHYHTMTENEFKLAMDLLK